MPLGIEIGAVEAGCLLDANTGVVTGRVFFCKTVDEATGVQTFVKMYSVFGAAQPTDTLPVGMVEGECASPAPDQFIPVALEELCVDVDGVPQAATPVAWFNQSDSSYTSTIYLDEMGLPIAGVVTPAADPCQCCPAPCEDIRACIQLQAFDQDTGLMQPGDTTNYEITLDGTTEAVINHDYFTTSDGLNKSTWYTPIIAAINALPGWTMTLITDVALPSNGKPTWRVEYEGPNPSTLEIIKTPNGDIYTIAVAADGTVTATTNDAGSGTPFGSDPIAPCA